MPPSQIIIVVLIVNPLSTELKQQYAAIKDPITKSADRMADADYGFKPAPGNTRTFAQIIGHIADVQMAICGAGSGGGMFGLWYRRTTATHATETTAKSRWSPLR